MKEDDRGIKPDWSVPEALYVFILTYGVGIILPLREMNWFQSLSTLISPEKSVFGELFLSSIISALLMFGCVYFIVSWKYQLQLRELGFVPDNPKKWLFKGSKHGILLFFGVSLLSIVLVLIYPFEVQPQTATEIFSTARGWQQVILVFIVVSILAPFSEELYFRGFLYPTLRKRWGKIPAIIITNIVFGILHFDLLRFIPITLGGIWLTVIYERSGTLYTSMVAHAVWNALMIGLIFAGKFITA